MLLNNNKILNLEGEDLFKIKSLKGLNKGRI